MIITKEVGEVTILDDTPANTQKKLRQWVSSGYKIEILYQMVITGSNRILTTLVRSKDSR